METDGSRNWPETLNPKSECDCLSHIRYFYFHSTISSLSLNLIAFYHLEKNVYAKISGLGFCDVT
jgi:hypothetical protein